MLGFLLIGGFATCIVAYILYKPFREKLVGWRTRWTGIFISVLGFLQMFDLSTVVAREHVGYWMLGIGILMLVLRQITANTASE